MKSTRAIILAGLLSLSCSGAALADGAFWSGDWYLTLGGSGFTAPKYLGDDANKLRFSPIISIGKSGPAARFLSRNDSAAVALIDQGAFRAGIAGKLIMPRDSGDSSELRGMKKIKLGGELGGFVDIYPTDWVRVRGELRQGIRSHSGVVADLAVDAFTDIAPNLRWSGGPRATWVSAKTNERYFGVSSAQSAAGGPSPYSPDGGLQSVGLGTALTWKATENMELATFAEYKRLTGDAGESSLIRERGSKNQYLIGVSASYKFGFNVP
jgi:outer membrane protein